MMVWAAYTGLFVVPMDYQQKDAFRIIFVHVPVAIFSSVVYTLMAAAAAVGFIWRIKVAHAVAAACAPVGVVFTVLALITGSIWARPMWGTYWTWDPRLTSVVVHLFLYLAFIVLHRSFDDIARADRAAAVLAMVGLVNVPIIKYSVVWWNSLHQGPTLSIVGPSSIDSSMIAPLLVMLLALALFVVAVVCDGVRVQILRRERNTQWLAGVV